MGEGLILTNNPLAVGQADEMEGHWAVRTVEGVGLAVVLEAALELVQAGWRLVSAPLPPNVPLIRAPYRSLILEKGRGRYDAEGIKMLEKAREKLQSLGSSALSGRVARDAAFIDRQLLLKAIQEVRALRLPDDARRKI
ncbi:MAG: GrdX family protein [Candidatus Adiutrix sp.]|jgi:hypothetical protein|nr:GrdX family protein [Candidatus Adiutrix sp.]